VARVVFAAGGTGGHLFPAVAVGEALKELEPKAEVLFIGSGRELEARILGGRGFVLHTVAAHALKGKGLVGIFKFLLGFPVAVYHVLQIYREFKPEAVIGFGGYPSFVPLFVAWMLRIPTLLQEQNSSAGLANKVLSRFVRRAFAPPGSSGLPEKNLSRIPNPVRSEFSQQNTPPTQFKKLLIIGGSQGAVSLNSAVVACAPLLEKLRLTIVHQTGARDFERMKEAWGAYPALNVEVLPFIDDMAAAYRVADLVISRAGAMTVAEIAASRRPAIFVPLSLAGGHQHENIQALVAAGAAKELEGGEGLSERLRLALEELARSPGLLATMGERAHSFSQLAGERSALVIAREILSYCEQKYSVERDVQTG